MVQCGGSIPPSGTIGNITKRITNKNSIMNNKIEFRASLLKLDGKELVEIQIENGSARYQSSVSVGPYREITRGRWQIIKKAKRSGLPYIIKYGEKLYLHTFMSVNSIG